ncbi:colicin D domain-containing protein [Microcoleus sp. Pol11C1]|uniref:colicin D domain-containing protein n=1 Tax=unclassified Microcoleus TaxID=2642155 RepID=UPI002FD70275
MRRDINVLTYVIQDKQLQSKFKHASDFGIGGSYSLENIRKFRNAIENHLQSSTTKVRNGTFRRMSVVHYFDPKTALNVILNDQGYFVSGWKLNEDQLKAIIDTGNIGGGS